MVRCKFVCQSKVPLEGNASISLGVVYSGSEENKAFFAATPGGSIQFYTVNEQAAKQFEIGKEYFVDFTLAVEPAKEEVPA
jgi:hypothetical protein